MARVTIAMPVWNCEKTLALAMNSIVRQSFEDWELLVIDDGSTDRTARIAKSYDDRRIRVFADGERRGLIGRLNEAIDLSKSGYFARMDGDDIAYPDRLSAQLAYMKSHPCVDLLGTGILVFGEEGALIGKRQPPTNHAEICSRPSSGFHMVHPTYFGKLEWFREFGYRAGAIRCEDQDLLLRSYRHSTFANLGNVHLGYREENLVLSKIIKARWYFAASQVRYALEKGEFLQMVAAPTLQAAKSIVDCAAVGSGIGYRLLRHRARSFESGEVARWWMVYNMVTKDI
jgi:glycosyltransferase involved in cell wall biosynthesis